MQYNNIKKLFLEESVSKDLEECKYNIINIEKTILENEKAKKKYKKIDDIWLKRIY